MKQFLLAVMLLTASLSAISQEKTFIQNDEFWYTTEGEPMYTNGGGIFRFTDPDSGKAQYYWYGVKYQESVDYVPKALGGSNSNITHFLAVTCYKSDDLINWTYVNDIVTNDTLPGFGWWLTRQAAEGHQHYSKKT